MNKDHFRQAAPKTIVATVKTGDKPEDSHSMLIQNKEFSTGSVGWYGSQKMLVSIGGETVNCVVNVTITAVGSKTWK